MRSAEEASKNVCPTMVREESAGRHPENSARRGFAVFRTSALGGRELPLGDGYRGTQAAAARAARARSEPSQARHFAVARVGAANRLVGGGAPPTQRSPWCCHLQPGGVARRARAHDARRAVGGRLGHARKGGLGVVVDLRRQFVRASEPGEPLREPPGEPALAERAGSQGGRLLVVGVRGANRPLLAAHRVGRAAVARLVDLRLARYPPVASGDRRLARYPPVAAPPLQVQLVAAHLVAGATDAEPRCARRRPNFPAPARPVTSSHGALPRHRRRLAVPRVGGVHLLPADRSQGRRLPVRRGGARHHGIAPRVTRGRELYTRTGASRGVHHGRDGEGGRGWGAAGRPGFCVSVSVAVPRACRRTRARGPFCC